MGFFFRKKELKYRLEDGCYTVIGIGSCSDADLVIPPTYNDLPVLRIAPGAFQGNLRIETVEIPEGVLSIGYGAFQNCTSLRRAVLPTTLETVEDHAFYGCSALFRIALPQGVTNLPQSVFWGCTSLSEADVSNVRTIREYAFSGCRALDHLDLSNAEVIADKAFEGCASLVDITPPKASCKTSVIAFEGCEKSRLGTLWIGNKYIDRLTKSAMENEQELRDGLYEIFLELTQDENPTEIRELWRIYLEVMKNVAAEGLNMAYCITYLADEDRERLARAIYERGYGEALYRVLRGEVYLFRFMATRVTSVSADDISRLERRINDNTNYMRLCEYTEARAELFLKKLQLYHPQTGEIGQRFPTYSVNFGGLMEDLELIFNDLYLHAEEMAK